MDSAIAILALLAVAALAVGYLLVGVRADRNGTSVSQEAWAALRRLLASISNG